MVGVNIVILLIGILLIGLREPLTYLFTVGLGSLPREYALRYQAFPAGLGAALLIASTASLVMAYLGGRLLPEHLNADESLRVQIREETEKSLAQLRQATKEAVGGSGIPAETRAEILKRADSYIANLLKDEAVAAMEEKYSFEVLAKTKRAAISAIYLESRQRLKTEIASLGRRGNINLTLGFISTTVALAVLGYISFQFTLTKTAVDQVNWPSLASSFVPRLTLAIFIQTFAFFFLRLYRATLDEIKYFQNELTNLDCYALAIELGASEECSQHAMDTSAALLKIDRNNVSPKKELGEKTVGGDDKARSELLSLAKDVIGKIK